MIESYQQEKKKLKRKLKHESDPEMDFVFWSHFEKEVTPKGRGAKLWAPLLLLGLLALVALSAYQQNL